MRPFSFDDKSAFFACRAILCLALFLLLVHSPRRETAFSPAPFVLAAAYLLTSAFLWRSPARFLQSGPAQAAAYLWDVGAASAVLYASQGFDDELFLMYFLIMFMSALMSRARLSVLVGTVSSLVYAWLWSRGKAAGDLPAAELLPRFAFFYAAAVLAAAMAVRVRAEEERARGRELKMTLARIANGGWGRQVVEEMDPALEPDIAKSVRTINSLMDNLTRALKRTMLQNEELRESAEAALLQLAHERERLEDVAAGQATSP